MLTTIPATREPNSIQKDKVWLRQMVACHSLVKACAIEDLCNINATGQLQVNQIHAQRFKISRPTPQAANVRAWNNSARRGAGRFDRSDFFCKGKCFEGRKLEGRKSAQDNFDIGCLRYPRGLLKEEPVGRWQTGSKISLAPSSGAHARQTSRESCQLICSICIVVLYNMPCQIYPCERTPCSNLLIFYNSASMDACTHENWLCKRVSQMSLVWKQVQWGLRCGNLIVSDHRGRRKLFYAAIS